MEKQYEKIQRSHTSRALCLLISALLLFWVGAADARCQVVSSLTDDEISGESPLSDATVENVFILVIDGVRNSEVFEDPTHQYTPHIWNDLRPLGTVYDNFFCMGYTGTTSGHAAFTAGATQFLHNSWLGKYGLLKIIQEEPSIFQYLRRQKGTPKEKTWIVNGKGVMIFWSGVTTNPFYRESFEPEVSFMEHHEDLEVWDEVNRIIDTHHPTLTLVNLPEVDGAGHRGKWYLYLQAIVQVDTIIYEICQKIWQDPYYKDNTAIIITADHGRCLDGVNQDFKSHGGTCFGCRRLPFLIIGPGIKQNHTVTRRAFQRDLAPTLAKMFGIQTEYTRGRVLREAFESPPPSDPPARMHPAVAYGGNRLHLVYCSRFDRVTQVVYTNSDDDGDNWNTPTVLSTSKENMWPSITADGDRVAVTWSSARIVNDSWVPFCVAVRESLDRGATWTDPVYAESDHTWTRGYLNPDVCYNDGSISMICAAPLYQAAHLIHARIENAQIVDAVGLHDDNITWPRCAASPEGVHAVYQKYGLIDKRDEVNYCLYADGAWGTPVSLSNPVQTNFRPDIAVDESGLHATWAVMGDQSPKVVVKNSADGITWGPTLEVSANVRGAWHPRIEAFSKGLVIIWEGYDNDIPSIFSSVSVDDGATWSLPTRISLAGANATFPVLALNATDAARLVWMKGPAPAELDSISVQY